jgi:hypothetical protein
MCARYTHTVYIYKEEVGAFCIVVIVIYYHYYRFLHCNAFVDIIFLFIIQICCVGIWVEH